MRLLIVDDNHRVRERVVAAVREIPGVGAVAEAAGGVDALAAIGAERPDLVLLDLALGAGPTGFDVLAALRPGRVAPPVIVLSNHADDELFRRRALALGAEAVFDKSTEFLAALEAVAVRVRRFHERRRGGPDRE